jgi:hypothetical protein
MIIAVSPDEELARIERLCLINTILDQKDQGKALQYWRSLGPLRSLECGTVIDEIRFHAPEASKERDEKRL